MADRQEGDGGALHYTLQDFLILYQVNILPNQE